MINQIDMAVARKRAARKSSRDETADGHIYFTKREVVRRARMAGRRASINAMQAMGFVVIARGTQLVRKYANGRIEIIGRI